MKIENDLLHQATLKELTIDEYKQLFVFLSNIPTNSFIGAISPVEIIRILSFLDFYDENSYEVSTNIAKYLLLLFQNDFVDSSSELLVSILTTENYVLSTLIFNELNQRIINNVPNSPIEFTDEFIDLILDFVFENNSELATASSKLLITYCKQSKDLCKTAFLSRIKPKFGKISHSINLFRYLHMVLDIAVNTLNRELFGLVMDAEIMEKFNELVLGDDLLANLNIIEMIRTLVSNQLGYQLVTQNGLLNNLYGKLSKVSQGEYNTILLPGYLGIFTELCRNHCIEVLKSYKEFVNILSENFDCSDVTLRMQVFGMLGTIVSFPDCKVYIHEHYETLVPRALQGLLHLFDRSTNENKISSGNTMTNIFSVPDRHDYYDYICEINRKWFMEINVNNKMMLSIFSLIKLPSEDLKVTGLDLALALSNQIWGLRLIADNSEIIDFLMIRSDGWKSCIDLKFTLIKNMVELLNRNSSTPVLINQRNGQKLNDYFSQGKYFGVFEAEMIVENDI